MRSITHYKIHHKHKSFLVFLYIVIFMLIAVPPCLTVQAAAASSSSSGYIAVASGWEHTLALKGDGTIYAWGDNSHGQLGDGSNVSKSMPVAVSGGLKGVKAISAGLGHSVALLSDGTVWAWGSNTHGELGDGTGKDSSVPVKVTGLGDIVAISAGADFTLALAKNGTVWGWGANDYGQLGNTYLGMRKSPVTAKGISGVSAIAAGSEHSAAIRKDGTVWAWGWNDNGQLGDGTTVSRSKPAQVAGLSGTVKMIAAGNMHTVALKTDGTVWCWGADDSGQLGDGAEADRHVPAALSSMTGVSFIAAGWKHTVVRTTAGMAYAWGLNDSGQLGDGTNAMKNYPVKVSGVTTAAYLSAGADFTVMLDSAGSIWSWGADDIGQLGDGGNTGRNTPNRASTKNGIIDVSAGWEFTLALMNNGTVWSWGGNDLRQLGDAGRSDDALAMQVPGLKNITAVSAGSEHSLAVSRSGIVYSWGSNLHGQLGRGLDSPKTGAPDVIPGISNVFEICAGKAHSIALKRDGTVWAWGSDLYGQLGDGSSGAGYDRYYPCYVDGLPAITAIAAGDDFSAALAKDGTVWAWGMNADGQLGDGTTDSGIFPVQTGKAAGGSGGSSVSSGSGSGSSSLSGVTAIAAGGRHMLALKKDGTVWAWGDNGSGQLGTGDTSGRNMPVQIPGLTEIMYISAGADYSLAVKKDGTVWSWGSNSMGQLGTSSYMGGIRNYPAQVKGIITVFTVSAGSEHVIALQRDGIVMSWGWNGKGQLGDGTFKNRATPGRVK